jgi:hypothetical protein
LQEQQLDGLNSSRKFKAGQARIAAEIAAAIKEQDGVADKLVAISNIQGRPRLPAPRETGELTPPVPNC